MAFQVALSHRAEQAIRRVTSQLQGRIYKGIEALKVEPFRGRPGADIKMLRGDRGQYRLRVGNYRIFYVVDENTVYVTDVRHRSHAYD